MVHHLIPSCPVWCTPGISTWSCPFINGVVQQISNNRKISLFADDIALYRIIYTLNYYASLQSDISAVSTCLASKYLNLNVTKCCCLLLSCKRTQFIPIPTLTLNDAPLAQVSSYVCSSLQILCGPPMSPPFAIRLEDW